MRTCAGQQPEDHSLPTSRQAWASHGQWQLTLLPARAGCAPPSASGRLPGTVASPAWPLQLGRLHPGGGDSDEGLVPVMSGDVATGRREHV